MVYQDTKVKSVKEFLDWQEKAAETTIKSDSGVDLDFGRAEMYYRGQACKSWDLVPGVFRNPSINEHELLHRSSLQLWKELSDFTSYLEKMVFLQHYGMPTRLLDVTFNPLIALYFACQSTICHGDGAVYCGDKQLTENQRIAELSAEFMFKYSFENFENDIKAFAKEKKLSVDYFCYPIFILPPINNPRIEHQSGAFVMAPLAKKGKDMITLCHDNLNDIGSFSEKRALIPDACKSGIIKELHRLGINKGSIFQTITEKIESIVQEERWMSENMNLSL